MSGIDQFLLNSFLYFFKLILLLPNSNTYPSPCIVFYSQNIGFFSYDSNQHLSCCLLQIFPSLAYEQLGLNQGIILPQILMTEMSAAPPVPELNSACPQSHMKLKSQLYSPIQLNYNFFRDVHISFTMLTVCFKDKHDI